MEKVYPATQTIKGQIRKMLGDPGVAEKTADCGRIMNRWNIVKKMLPALSAGRQSLDVCISHAG